MQAVAALRFTKAACLPLKMALAIVTNARLTSIASGKKDVDTYTAPCAMCGLEEVHFVELLPGGNANK